MPQLLGGLGGLSGLGGMGGLGGMNEQQQTGAIQGQGAGPGAGLLGGLGNLLNLPTTVFSALRSLPLVGFLFSG